MGSHSSPERSNRRARVRETGSPGGGGDDDDDDDAAATATASINSADCGDDAREPARPLPPHNAQHKSHSPLFAVSFQVIRWTCVPSILTCVCLLEY